MTSAQSLHSHVGSLFVGFGGGLNVPKQLLGDEKACPRGCVGKLGLGHCVCETLTVLLLFSPVHKEGCSWSQF